MRKKYKTGAALGMAAVGLVLVGCGLGEPSKSQIESSLRQPILAQVKEDGAPSYYLDDLQKNLKIALLKNNGCKPTVEKTFECDVTLELVFPEYRKGNGPSIDAQKNSIDVSAKYLMTSSGWSAEILTIRPTK